MSRTRSRVATASFQAPKENCFPKYTRVHKSHQLEGKFQLEGFPSVIPWVKHRNGHANLICYRTQQLCAHSKPDCRLFPPLPPPKTYRRRTDGRRFLRNLVTPHWEVFWYSSVFKVRNVTSKNCPPRQIHTTRKTRENKICNYSKCGCEETSPLP